MPADNIALSFLLGILSSSNPCALPLYPGLIAYMASKSSSLGRRASEGALGLIVLSGVLSSMVTLGAATALFTFPLGAALSVVVPIVDLVLILLGTALILQINFWRYVPKYSPKRLSNPIAQAFAYGLLYGPIVLPCNAPLVLSVVTYSVTVTESIQKILLFTAFGLGLGLPLALISVMSKAQDNWLFKQLNRRHNVFVRVAGLLLVGIGTYDLVVVYQFLRLYF